MKFHQPITSRCLRTTRLICDYGMRLVFVFDGKPTALKAKEVEKRREARKKAEREYSEALRLGDYATAWSKAVMTSRLTKSLVEDAKKLLTLLGIPYVQAPSEGEAQAAYMCSKGDVWAASSRDYDSLLFGTPRLVRYLTISGKEFLPSKGIARPLKPELIDLQEFLRTYDITREQLVDLALLVGTDFNEGVRGIGPKRALSLVKKHSSLENMPKEILCQFPTNYREIREFFLNPEATSHYRLDYMKIQDEELYSFLCSERGFSRDRVRVAVERMKKFERRVSSLERWIPF